MIFKTKNKNNKLIISGILFILLITENILLLLFIIPLINNTSNERFSNSVLYKEVAVYRETAENLTAGYNSVTYITTLSERLKLDTVPYPFPFAPPTPFRLNIKKHGLVNLSIIDSNKVILKEYKFPVHKGEYLFEWWAYDNNLSQGRYLFKFDLPDTTEIYHVFK